MRAWLLVMALDLGCRGCRDRRADQVKPAPEQADVTVARPSDVLLEVRICDVQAWMKSARRDTATVDFARDFGAPADGAFVAVFPRDGWALAASLSSADAGSFEGSWALRGRTLVIAKNAALLASATDYLIDRAERCHDLPAGQAETNAFVDVHKPLAVAIDEMEPVALSPKGWSPSFTNRIVGMGPGRSRFSIKGDRLVVEREEQSAQPGIPGKIANTWLASAHGGSWTHAIETNAKLADHLQRLVLDGPDEAAHADAVALVAATGTAAMLGRNVPGCGMTLADVHLRLTDAKGAREAMRKLARRAGKIIPFSRHGFVGEEALGARGPAVFDDRRHVAWGVRGDELWIGVMELVGSGDADCPDPDVALGLAAAAGPIVTAQCPPGNNALLSDHACAAIEGNTLRLRADFALDQLSLGKSP